MWRSIINDVLCDTDNSSSIRSGHNFAWEMDCHDKHNILTWLGSIETKLERNFIDEFISDGRTMPGHQLAVWRPPCSTLLWCHMSVMAYQTTGNSTVCSTICSGVNPRKHQIFVLLSPGKGNPPVTGGFLSQRASNMENVPWNNIIIHRFSKVSFVISAFVKKNWPWHQNSR